MSEPTTAAGRLFLQILDVQARYVGLPPELTQDFPSRVAAMEAEAAAAARTGLLDELATAVLEIRPSTPVSREALPMTAGYCDGIDAVLHEISRRRPMTPTTP